MGVVRVIVQVEVHGETHFVSTSHTQGLKSEFSRFREQ